MKSYVPAIFNFLLAQTKAKFNSFLQEKLPEHQEPNGHVGPRGTQTHTWRMTRLCQQLFRAVQTQVHRGGGSWVEGSGAAPRTQAPRAELWSLRLATLGLELSPVSASSPLSFSGGQDGNKAQPLYCGSCYLQVPRRLVHGPGGHLPRPSKYRFHHEDCLVPGPDTISLLRVPNTLCVFLSHGPKLAPVELFDFFGWSLNVCFQGTDCTSHYALEQKQ